MALTTTSTLSSVKPTEFVDERIIEEARPYNVVAPLVHHDVLPEGEGNVYQISQLPSTSAAAVSEGSDITATARTTSGHTITIAEVGLATDVSMFARETTKLRDLETWEKSAGRAIAQKLTGDLCALFVNLNSSGSGAVGTSGTDITVANFIEAGYVLENNNAPMPYVCVLHPRQKADLASAIVAAGGAVYENLPELVRNGALPDGTPGNGFWGVFLGVPIYVTTEIVTANSGADLAGAVFSREAMGYIKQRPITTVYEDDASKRTTEVVTTVSYGVGEIVDTYGVPIVTDA